MKIKHVFALKGPANVGKSATIRRVFMLLKEAYPTARIQIINPPGIEITVTIEVDITVTIEIDGTVVGIESQGDPNGRLSESIEQFKKTKCSIIVCATRTKLKTVATVKNLEPEFTVTWYRKQSEPQDNLREQGDNALAQIIFKEVQKALNSQ